MSKSLSGSTEPIERVYIIGAGAVGAAYASIFYDMNQSCVSFIAGGERFERLHHESVIVNGKDYPIPVLNSKEPFPAADLLIVTVKHHHLDQAIGEMKSGVGPNTIIISLMNGIDSEERIGAIYLPENCANVCFGGPRRNRLFMTASQSLYAVYVNTTGAHIC